MGKHLTFCSILDAHGVVSVIMFKEEYFKRITSALPFPRRAHSMQLQSCIEIKVVQQTDNDGSAIWVALQWEPSMLNFTRLPPQFGVLVPVLNLEQPQLVESAIKVAHSVCPAITTQAEIGNLSDLSKTAHSVCPTITKMTHS